MLIFHVIYFLLNPCFEVLFCGRNGCFLRLFYLFVLVRLVHLLRHVRRTCHKAFVSLLDGNVDVRWTLMPLALSSSAFHCLSPSPSLFPPLFFFCWCSSYCCWCFSFSSSVIIVIFFFCFTFFFFLFFLILYLHLPSFLPPGAPGFIVILVGLLKVFAEKSPRGRSRGEAPRKKSEEAT